MENPISNQTEKVPIQQLREDIKAIANRYSRKHYEESVVENDETGKLNSREDMDRTDSIVDQLPDEIVDLFSSPHNFKQTEDKPSGMIGDLGWENEVYESVEGLKHGNINMYESTEGAALIVYHKSADKIKLLRNNALARPETCQYRQVDDMLVLTVQKVQKSNSPV